MRLPALSALPALLILYVGTISVSGPKNEHQIFGKNKIKIEKIRGESESTYLIFNSSLCTIHPPVMIFDLLLNIM